MVSCKKNSCPPNENELNHMRGTLIFTVRYLLLTLHLSPLLSQPHFLEISEKSITIALKEYNRWQHLLYKNIQPYTEVLNPFASLHVNWDWGESVPPLLIHATHAYDTGMLSLKRTNFQRSQEK